MARTIKPVEDIRSEIVARAAPRSESPGVTTITHDMRIRRLSKPDTTGCNWTATFKIGPPTMQKAIDEVKAIYNLPAAPAPIGKSRISVKGAKIPD